MICFVCKIKQRRNEGISVYLNNVMGELLYEKIRREFGQSDMERDKNERTPDDIERFDDILYGEDKEYNVLDVYRPKEYRGKNLPVIISVHGGAWVYGSKEVYQYYCMKLAQRGFAVVNFTYRLAPEFKFPAAIIDLKNVCQWIVDNKKEYGFDIDNVFAVGDSAGAHMLGLYAGIATNTEASDAYNIIHPKEVKLRAIALNCGKFVMDEQDKLTEDNVYQYIFEDGGTQEELKKAEVTRYITPEYPSTFIMTCPGDFLKDQAKYMVFKLEENDVSFAYHFYGNNKNKLGHVFHCSPTLEEAVICNDDECNFFKNYMK